MERRLVAILAADMVGYSRLMGEDEAGTLAAVRAHREGLIDPKIAQYHGRIVKLMGDGLLAEFPSAVEAVQCAVEIQHALGARTDDLSEDQRFAYRVGINIGDIVVEDNDIYGDGVNVAARLEALAEPGGVCVARNVFNQVKGKLELTFEHVGEKEVKNIAEPVSVYRVVLDAKAAALVTPIVQAAPRSLGARRLVAAAAAVVVLLLALGVALWWQSRLPGLETASIEKMAFPLPDKPSIVVLPFANMSDDPSQEYFADGMTEDLITDLSKISGLFVIARNSTFAYKGKSRAIKQVAEELGIRYVLEGSVRRAGDQVRITTQLIDATTGRHLWAERYDGSLSDVFGVQDEVTRKIVSVLAVQLTTGEEEATARKETTSAQAYDVFLKGWDQYSRQTPESLQEAITHFEKAVELDPDYSRAYAALSASYWQIQKRRWHAKFGFRSVHDARIKAEEFLEKTKRQPTALSHQVAAAMLSQEGRHTEAIAEGGKAIGVDPNDADSYVALAGALSLAGNPDEALQLMQQAMRLNPHFPPYYLYELGLAQFGIEDFQRAAASLEEATALNSDDRWSYRLLLATYGHLGREADADRLFKGIERNWRGYDPISIRAVTFWYPFKEAADRERLATGLRKANVPD